MENRSLPLTLLSNFRYSEVRQSLEITKGSCVFSSCPPVSEMYFGVCIRAM